MLGDNGYYKNRFPALTLQLAAELEPQNQWYLLPLADVQIRRKNQNGARQTLKPLLRPGAPPNLRQGAEELLRRISQ